MRLPGIGRSAIRGNRILSVWPPGGATLKRRSIHPRSPRCQAVPAERFFQKGLAPQFQTDVETMKAEKKALGFGEGLATEGKALKPTPIQLQGLLESPQRAQVHRESGCPHLQCMLGANDPAIRYQKTGPRCGGPAAAHAASQLWTQPQGIQGSQLNEEP